MGQIIPFRGLTSHEIPVASVCDAAKESCTRVLILGECADETLYFAASIGDKAQLLLWIEQFKFCLLNNEYDVS